MLLAITPQPPPAAPLGARRPSSERAKNPRVEAPVRKTFFMHA
jgi:hypothetical protein